MSNDAVTTPTETTVGFNTGDLVCVDHLSKPFIPAEGRIVKSGFIRDEPVSPDVRRVQFAPHTGIEAQFVKVESLRQILAPFAPHLEHIALGFWPKSTDLRRIAEFFEVNRYKCMVGQCAKFAILQILFGQQLDRDTALPTELWVCADHAYLHGTVSCGLLPDPGKPVLLK